MHSYAHNKYDIKGAQISGPTSPEQLTFVQWHLLLVGPKYRKCSCHTSGTRIFGWPLEFWKICAPLYNMTEDSDWRHDNCNNIWQNDDRFHYPIFTVQVKREASHSCESNVRVCCWEAKREIGTYWRKKAPLNKGTP